MQAFEGAQWDSSSQNFCEHNLFCPSALALHKAGFTLQPHLFTKLLWSSTHQINHLFDRVSGVRSVLEAIMCMILCLLPNANIFPVHLQPAGLLNTIFQLHLCAGGKESCSHHLGTICKWKLAYHIQSLQGQLFYATVRTAGCQLLTSAHSMQHN